VILSDCFVVDKEIVQGSEQMDELQFNEETISCIFFYLKFSYAALFL
jgi:hypothetical protein